MNNLEENKYRRSYAEAIQINDPIIRTNAINGILDHLLNKSFLNQKTKIQLIEEFNTSYSNQLGVKLNFDFPYLNTHNWGKERASFLSDQPKQSSKKVSFVTNPPSGEVNNINENYGNQTNSETRVNDPKIISKQFINSNSLFNSGTSTNKVVYWILALIALFSFFGFNWITLALGLVILFFLIKSFFNRSSSIEYLPSNGGSSFSKLLSFLLFSLLLFAIYYGWKHHWSILTPLLGIISLIFILSVFSKILQALRWIFNILLFSVLAIALFAALKSNSNWIVPKEQAEDDSEEKAKYKEETDSNGYVNVTHLRKWKDYAGKEYQASIEVNGIDFKSSRVNRNHIEKASNYGVIYANMFENDSPIMPSLFAALDSIKEKNAPDYKRFAEIIVCLVQDIPYYLVHDLSCQELLNSTDNSFIHQYHQDGGACLSEIKFGVQAPIEFSYNLKGDCDTRTVLCYTLLEHYGYDSAVLISPSYGHSILGINIPSQGAYKQYKGRKYYIWETTAKDMQIGQVPPSCNNMNYWSIALESNNIK